MKALFDGLKKMTKGNGPPVHPMRTVPVPLVNGHGPESEAVEATTHSAGPKPDRDLAAVLQLQLGDFLPRISPELIRAGEHDPLTPIAVPVAQVARCLAGGGASGTLAEIFANGPDIFEEGVLQGPAVEVLYPWRKILDQVREFLRDDEVGAGLLAALEASKKLFIPPAEPVNFSQPPRDLRSTLMGASNSRTTLNGRKPLGAAVSWYSPQPTNENPLNAGGHDPVTDTGKSPTLLKVPEPISPAPERPVPPATAVSTFTTPTSMEPDSSVPDLSLVLEAPATTREAGRTTVIDLPDLSLLPSPSAPHASAVEHPRLAVLPSPTAKKVTMLEITDEQAPMPDLAIVLDPGALPELTVLADPAPREARPDLALVSEGPSTSSPSSALHSLDRADVPDLTFVSDSVGSSVLPDLSVVTAPTPAPTTAGFTFEPGSEPRIDLKRELVRIQEERDSAVAQLDSHSAVSARERSELQQEHESVIATLMAEHETALAKMRADHAASLAEMARLRREDRSAAAASQTEEGSDLQSKLEWERGNFHAQITALESARAAAVTAITAERDEARESLTTFQSELAVLRGGFAQEKSRIERIRQEALSKAAAKEAEIAALHETHAAALAAVKDQSAPASAPSDTSAHEQRLAEKDAQLAWSSRSIATLEEEVETYRQRIKVVLQQRDEATRAEVSLKSQVADLQAQLDSQSALAAQQEQSAGRLADQSRALAALKERVAALTVSAGEILHQVSALSSDEGAVVQPAPSEGQQPSSGQTVVEE